MTEAISALTAGQSFEERIAPYIEMIDKLKEEISKRGDDFFGFGEFLHLNDVHDYAELVATMALFEEYELLDRLFNVETEFIPSRLFNEETELIPSLLNTRVRSGFSSWQPTPLYIITTKTAQAKMKDPCKMLRFLVAHGADPNQTAGDGSTSLWNQTCSDGSLVMLQTLLELGADPNQICMNNENEWTPLIYCLCPEPDENDENGWLPLDVTAINKAKLLLVHGADPNLVPSSLTGNQPISMAIRYGFQTNDGDSTHPEPSDTLKLIEMLLQRGADPNAVDFEGKTPVMLASENDLPETVKLLLLHGANNINTSSSDESDEALVKGEQYYSGDGVEQNYEKAVYWYTKAAEQGNVYAEYCLGWCYSKGLGVAQDDGQAINWYAKAGENGNVDAQYNLGLIYDCAEDYGQAAYWFAKAAEQDCADAQYLTGIAYYHGQGIEQDINKAVYWCKKAAEQGHEEAQNYLPRWELKQTALKGNNPKPYSNPGYVFADWAGIDDDDHESYPEVPVLRRYNYNLETGAVGTDDNNIATVLYNINRMEIEAYTEFFDEEELNEALDDLYDLMGKSSVHLNRFIETFGDKVDNYCVQAAISVFGSAVRFVREARSETADFAKKADIFPTIYKKFLDIVPLIVAIDEEARYKRPMNADQRTDIITQFIHRLAIAIDERPKSIELHLERSKAYCVLEKWLEGVHDCSQALALEPDNTEALLRRGIAYYKLNNLDDAIADFQNGLSLTKSDKDMHKHFQSCLEIVKKARIESKKT